MNTQTIAQPEAKTRFGRFSLQVPKRFELSSARYALAHVMIREEGWNPEDKDGNDTWRLHLDNIRQYEAPLDVEGDRVFAEPEVSPPFLHMAFHYDVAISEIVTVTALAHHGPTAVWYELDGGSQVTDLMSERIEWLAGAYRQPRDAQETQISRSFFTARGSFLIPDQEMEEVNLRFRRESDDAVLSLETIVMAEVSSRSRAAAFRDELAHWPELSGQYREIRNRLTEVAGRNGEEVVFWTKEGNDEQLLCTWFHEGVAGDARRPQIEIRLEMTAGDLDFQLAEWDTILTGLSPLD